MKNAPSINTATTHARLPRDLAAAALPVTAAGEAASGRVTESLLQLHESLLGCIDVDTLLNRFLDWARAQALGQALRYHQGALADTATAGRAQRPPPPNSFRITLGEPHAATLTLTRRAPYRAAERAILQRSLNCLGLHLSTALDLQSYQRLALHDGLTGLLNRKSLDLRLTEEMSRARRHGSALSVMLIDVDHFKQLNDQLGHLNGDHTLRVIADIFSAVTRESDLVFRYGGDEFAIVLPLADLAAAQRSAERILHRLRSLPIAAFSLGEGGGTQLRPDLSIGIAQYAADDTEADLLRRADRQLYAAKSRGRGRVCAGTDPDAPD